MITCHALSVTAFPYSEGSPRYYYAEDYATGSTVENKGESWSVEAVNNVVMFVLSQDDTLIRLKQEARLKACVKRYNAEDGKVIGWWACLKDVKTNLIVWTHPDWMMWRDHGGNAARPAAVSKLISIR